MDSAELYPCEDCAGHLLRYLKRHPLPVEGREELETYFCRLHNVLNKMLKKPEFDCSKIEEKYGGDCSECKGNKPFATDL